MNRIVMLNGSPKKKGSASEQYLNMIYENLDNNYYIEEYDMNKLTNSIKKSILNADMLIIATPLYIDCLPSHVIKFLMELGDNDISGKEAYFLVNCGFLEGVHTDVSVEILKNYCDYHHLIYKGSLGIGAGPIAYKKRFYNYFVKKELNIFSNYINYHKNYEDDYVRPLIPRFIYILFANINWFIQIKSFKKN